MNRSADRPSHGSLLYEQHHGFVWRVCYRMTGSAADADDLTQETFVRAVTHPPKDLGLPWRPWLAKVAVNLATDELRRRKRRAYPGTWLPEPVAAEPGTALATHTGDDVLGPDARYDSLESVTYAFLVALEALTARQRAVLILRDVLDLDGEETAGALNMSLPNVKTTLHRARRVMADYDASRQLPGPELAGRMSAALAQLATALVQGDVDGVMQLLSQDVSAWSDGGGVFHAAKLPVTGAGKVARMYCKLSKNTSPGVKVQSCDINGQPALLVDDPDPRRPNAPRSVFRVDVDGTGKILRIYTILAPAKLARMPFDG